METSVCRIDRVAPSILPRGVLHVPGAGFSVLEGRLFAALEARRPAEARAIALEVEGHTRVLREQLRANPL